MVCVYITNTAVNGAPTVINNVIANLKFRHRNYNRNRAVFADCHGLPGSHYNIVVRYQGTSVTDSFTDKIKTFGRDVSSAVDYISCKRPLGKRIREPIQKVRIENIQTGSDQLCDIDSGTLTEDDTCGINNENPAVSQQTTVNTGYIAPIMHPVQHRISYGLVELNSRT